MFRKKCIHQWVEKTRTFNPPNPNLKSLTNATEYTMDVSLYGKTIVELKCNVCGDIQFKTVIGKTTNYDN